MKAKVEISKHTQKEIEGILGNFGVKAKSYTRLYGGYSSSNYKVETSDNKSYVLKIMNGYDKKWVEDQTKIQEYIHRRGFLGGCPPVVMSTSLEEKGYVAMCGSTPTCLLTFLDGKNADQALIDNPNLSESKVLESLGEGLALLHSIRVTPDAGLRDFKQGGACLVADHMNGIYLTAFEDSKHTCEHPFLPFYRKEMVNLIDCMCARTLPTGILHGDPFLDNVLVNPETGEFNAFVDWEDTTVGPLLFDVACCVIGTCYSATTNDLDTRRMKALLTGYHKGRRLSLEEKEMLPRYMQLTLLCNCAWRFKKFNIDCRDIKASRNSYIELQERILKLSDERIRAEVEHLLKTLRIEKAGFDTCSMCKVC